MRAEGLEPYSAPWSGYLNPPDVLTHVTVDHPICLLLHFDCGRNMGSGVLELAGLVEIVKGRDGCVELGDTR